MGFNDQQSQDLMRKMRKYLRDLDSTAKCQDIFLKIVLNVTWCISSILLVRLIKGGVSSSMKGG